jgi:16S rRNA (cytosine967-C5)-methyltransferase
MVNAVLRKLTEVKRPSADDAALAAHPRWLRDRWERNYGAFAMRRMCVYDQQVPPVALRKFEEEKIAAGAQPGKLLARAAIADADPTAARDEGVRIQDEGSQLVAELAAAANPAARRVLDCCAAPGGKTAVLAQSLAEARVTAMDISAQRLAIAEQRMPGKLRERIEFRVGDAREMRTQKERYELVLCDAPCSGTGTIARNPEIRTRLSEGDFARQAARQRAILEGASAAVAAGGTLVYSTCSMEPEENEQIVEQFAKRFAEFRAVACADLLAALEERGALMPEAMSLLDGVTRGNYLRTIPGLHPCDGFFIAVFRRAE